MIIYDGAKFHPRFMVQIKGSVMPFACMVALPCALLAVAMKMMSQTVPAVEVWDAMGIDDSSHQVISAAFSGMNFLIGFLVVFRAQQAYSRFWEGCTAICTMQGEWFDAASALVAFTKCSRGSARDVLLFHHTLVRLISLLNACILMELSSGIQEKQLDTEVTGSKRALELELIDAEGLDSQTLLAISSTPHKVQLLFTWIQQLIVENDNKEVFSVGAPILSRCFQVLGNGMLSYRQAFKIASIPLPFPYVQATEMLLVSHWLLIPFLMCVWVTSPVWTGVLTFVQVAFFWSLNSIATELENPFGEDVNDLPAQIMQREFNAELLLLLRPSTANTGKLSKKAILNEDCEVIGRYVSLNRKGLNKDKPNLHKRRSSLEGSTISLAQFQERINRIGTEDYMSESGSELSSGLATDLGKWKHPPESRNSSKEGVLPPVAEASQDSAELRGEARPAVTLGACSDDRDGSEHPGGDEVIGTRTGSKGKVGFDRPGHEAINNQGALSKAKVHFGEFEPRGRALTSQTREGRCAEDKFTDPLQAAATRQLVADLACLPELVTVCEDLRDTFQDLKPDIISEQLLCLQELVSLARDEHDRAHTFQPVVGPSPAFGAFSAQRGNVEAEQFGRAALQRGSPKLVDAGCISLRSCTAQESHWSASMRR